MQKALDALLNAWFKASGSAEEAVEVMAATAKGLRRKYADRRPWDEVGKKVASSGRKQKPPKVHTGMSRGASAGSTRFIRARTFFVFGIVLFLIRVHTITWFAVRFFEQSSL